ncbi:MAG TPA: hypothetical protein VMW66_00615 [Elusimicrobiales bacterium]|nr:hypothetical protein [Elusimicrobiales bacterium]
MLEINKIKKNKKWWFKCHCHSHKEFYILVIAIKKLMEQVRTPVKKKTTVQIVGKSRIFVDGKEIWAKDNLRKK